MMFPKFKCQDDAINYVIDQIVNYIIEYYNPIIISDKLSKKYVINNNGFDFYGYYATQFEFSIIFDLNPMFYDEIKYVYYRYTQVDRIKKSFPMGYFKEWDETTFKKLFDFVDDCMKIATDLNSKSNTYYNHQRFEKMN